MFKRYLFVIFCAVFSINLSAFASIPYDYGTLVATQSSVTFTEGTSSNHDFWLPVNGEKKYYNVVTSGSSHEKINNTGTIAEVDAYFRDLSGNYGGAIYNNNGTITTLTADFIRNTASSDGGAIYNGGTITTVTGNFINNSARRGGAIYGRISLITSLTGDFIGNTASEYGGAINGDKSSIGSIRGNFINNSSFRNGGAISIIGNSTSPSTIGSIEGNFISNTADKHGGAIYIDYASISSITGSTFEGNTVGEYGGAIYNSGTIESITNSTFKGNTVGEYGGAIYNSGTIESITNSTFKGNTVGEYGGAIYNSGTIESITNSTFKGNTADKHGGVIYNTGTIESIIGSTFEGNTAGLGYNGGAIANWGTIETIVADFISNTAANYGGAIDMTTTTMPSVTGNFYYNSAGIRGGAISGGDGWGTIGIVAGDKDVIFYGNTDSTGYNDIWQSGTTVNLNATSGRSISFGGSIVGNMRYSRNTLNINNGYSGSSIGGTYVFGNTISDNRLNLYNGAYVKLGSIVQPDDSVTYGTLSIRAFTTDSTIATLDSQNAHIDSHSLGTTTLGSNLNYLIDLQHPTSGTTGTADKLTYSGNGGNKSVIITAINELNSRPTASGTYTYQVLSGSGLTLALDPAVQNAWNGSSTVVTEWVNDAIADETSWGKQYYKYRTSTNITTSLAVSGNNLVYTVAADTPTEETQSMGDTLALVAGSDLANKTFSAGSASDEYVFAKRFEDENPSEFVEGVGDVVGELNVSGVISGDLRSKLNLNQRKGFSLTAPSSLTLSNIEITNATDFVVDNVTVDRSLMLLNANLKNNITDDKAVINAFDGGNVVIKADGADSVFDNPAAHAGVDIDGGMLDLQTQNGGNIVFNDEITGNVYNVSVDSDEKGKIRFNKNVTGADVFSITENSNIALGIEAVVNAENIFALGESVFLTIDAEVDRQNNTINTGKLQASTDLEGKFAIIVNSLNPHKLDDDNDAITPFLFAPNDDLSTQTEVFVSRVLGSPYMWEALLNARGETAGSTWYLAMRGNENGGNEVAPEVLGAIGLHESAVEQTRNVARNISSKLAARKECVGGCGVYDHAYNGEKLSNAWVLIEGQTADVKKPVDVDVKTKGVDAGFDVQSDAHNNLGVFGSYIKGRHNMSGKGKKVYSTIGAKADIESFLAGLYYRFDKNYNFLFASVYGGVLQAEVKSKDGLAKLKTDGVELGAALEAGRTLLLSKHVSLTPMVGLYFTQIDFDATKDNVGKHYRFDNIKHLEAELALRLARDFANGNVYVQPAVVQNITRNDKIKITDIQKQPTYHDQTLGRLEVGGRYDLGEQLSGYISGKYTFGSNYRSLAGTLGLSYAF